VTEVLDAPVGGAVFGVEEVNRLVGLYRLGDQGALDELYRAYYPVALRAARRYSSCGEDAADLAQEAFVRVAAALRRGEGRITHLHCYLETTVRRLAAWAARKRAPFQVSGDIARFERERVEHLPEDGALQVAFESLPDRWRRVLWLSVVEGLERRLVAELMGLSGPAAGMLSNRALNGLRAAYLVAVARQDAKACPGWAELLVADSRGRLDADREAEMLAHLAGCKACEGSAAVLRRLAGRLKLAALGPMVALFWAGPALKASAAPLAGLAAFPWWAPAGAKVAVAGLLAAAAAGAGLIVAGEVGADRSQPVAADVGCSAVWTAGRVGAGAAGAAAGESAAGATETAGAAGAAGTETAGAGQAGESVAGGVPAVENAGAFLVGPAADNLCQARLLLDGEPLTGWQPAHPSLVFLTPRPGHYTLELIHNGAPLRPITKPAL
jgi:RNA polymerase sigma factor (sigma-70 family)